MYSVYYVKFKEGDFSNNSTIWFYCAEASFDAIDEVAKALELKDKSRLESGIVDSAIATTRIRNPKEGTDDYIDAPLRKLKLLSTNYLR